MKQVFSHSSHIISLIYSKLFSRKFIGLYELYGFIWHKKWYITHRIHGAAIYGVPCIPSTKTQVMLAYIAPFKIYSEFSHENRMVDLSIVFCMFTRPGKPPFSYGFPMVFPLKPPFGYHKP